MIFRMNDEAFHDAWYMDYEDWRNKHENNIEEITYCEWKRKYALDARREKKSRPRWDK